MIFLLCQSIINVHKFTPFNFTICDFCFILVSHKNHTMDNLICTRFSSLRNTKPEREVYLTEVLQEIKSDLYRNQIERIRSEDNPSKSPLKDRLPVFTPTGQFSYRSLAGLETYNGVVCLDIDSVEDPADLKEKCRSIDWVYAAFVTPSGKGLKVITQTTANKENYRNVEIQVATAFQEATGFMRDNHCKDIARIQFVSHDPEIYINEKSNQFTAA
jgi:hypothetical protein